MDGIHDLATFHFLELGLSDWYDKSNISAIGKKSLNNKIIDALGKVRVTFIHTWKISVDFIAINSKMWDESFVLLTMTHIELITETLSGQHVLKISSLLNMELALLFKYDCSIG